MSSRPSAELRRQVIERAGNRCEYCLIHQDDAVAGHQTAQQQTGCEAMDASGHGDDAIE
jgi:hypothetical protein